MNAATPETSEGITGTAIDVWGGLVGDRIKYWRQRNLISTLEKTSDFLKRKNVNLSKAHALPDGAMYQIFEGTIKSDDHDIQKLWAGLLSETLEAAEPNPKLNSIVICISNMLGADAILLKLISSFDAKIE